MDITALPQSRTASFATTKLLKVLLIVCFAALLANYAITVVNGLRADEVWALDFRGYYAAAAAVNAGENPYTAYENLEEVRSLGSVEYRYPPTFATLLSPLAYQSEMTAQFAWLIANQVFFVLAIILSIKIVNYRFSPWQLLLIVCVMLSSYPVYTNMKLGNVSMLLYLIVALTYWCWQRGNRRATAFFLAAGIALKLIPILIALYFLWKKEYYLVLLAALFTMLLVVLPDLLLGTTMLANYFASFFDIVDSLYIKPSWVDNQSFYGLFSRLSLLFSQHEIGGVLATLLNPLLALIGTVLVLYVSPRNRRPSDPLTILEFGLVLFLFPLISNNTFTHYYVWGLLLVPALIYLVWVRFVTRTSPQRWILMGATFMGFVLMSQPFRIPRMLGYNVEVDTLSLDTFGILLQSLLLYGALLIVGVAVYLMLTGRRKPAPITEPAVGSVAVP
jgi:alpha-1,2-mannosyltransferase